MMDLRRKLGGKYSERHDLSDGRDPRRRLPRQLDLAATAELNLRELESTAVGRRDVLARVPASHRQGRFHGNEALRCLERAVRQQDSLAESQAPDRKPRTRS